MLLKIGLCHYRNDSKPDIRKQIFLISKQKISSGNQIYFFREGDEETAVFDDDGKDFRSSIYFSKEMKRQLGLAPGFPLELCHNPNPKLEIPAVPFHGEASEASEAGETREAHALKDALVQQEIYVTPRDKFKIKFRDIFTDTVIAHRSSTESRRWLAGPNFEYWPQQLNFAFFCATTGCGVSQRILFEDKMRDGKNDLTDSELNLPPQVRSFFWFHVYFTVRRILFELGGVQNSLALPGDSAFNQTKNKYDIPFLNVSALNLGSHQTPIFDLQKATIMALEVFSNISPTQVTSKHHPNILPKRQSLKTKEVVLLLGTLFLISKTQKRETSMNISCVLSRTGSQVLV